eukprot:6202888-Pleurochrysis_carterae.AAC.1
MHTCIPRSLSLLLVLVTAKPRREASTNRPRSRASLLNEYTSGVGSNEGNDERIRGHDQHAHQHECKAPGRKVIGARMEGD